MLKKTRLKQLIYGIELRGTAIIANGLVHRVPKRIIMERIKQEIVRSNKYIGLNATEIGDLYTKFLVNYTDISRKVYAKLRKTDENYKEELSKRQDVVYSEMRKSVLKRIERDKNRLADTVDYRNKEEDLEDLLTEGVFFLCSSHEKPAKDHENYEGKVYITEKWENRVSDPHLKARIKAYVRNHNIQTVEWVTGPPVYMIYRPNCKHYFIDVSVEEVLGHSTKSLLKAHKMYMPNEVPMSYEKSQYKAYYERLKALQYLSEMCPSAELDKDIKKTKKLVQKWYRASK